MRSRWLMLFAVPAVIGLAGCEIQQEEEGELPELENGELPEAEVETGTPEVTEEDTLQIRVPEDIDVDTDDDVRR